MNACESEALQTHDFQATFKRTTDDALHFFIFVQEAAEGMVAVQHLEQLRLRLKEAHERMQDLEEQLQEQAMAREQVESTLAATQREAQELQAERQMCQVPSENMRLTKSMIAA